ncbi:class I SAM-dependent methyltransferase [Glycocaulis abyssi]|uniref:Class I SAM-dependent methyltransferase n=1 Tax=Glycocaulis abyssi TaxID=1433403 RepID=A0ABV9NB09_9PROT
MRTEAIEIDRFYRSQRGEAARTMVHRRLQALWPEVKGLDMLGYGFAGPYLEPFREKARRAVAFMPSAQGAIAWPDRHGERCASVLGEETRLPFAEAMFDRIVAVHTLEEADDLQRLLRELWRVLAPEGRLVIVAAHRAGAWARVDATPFGHGRPFSRGQLTRLLTGALFEPIAWARALYAPPWNMFCGPRLSGLFESAGERFWPGFGGLILVEAVKHVGAIRPTGAAVPVRRKALDAAPGAALSPPEPSRTLTAKDKSQ